MMKSHFFEYVEFFAVDIIFVGSLASFVSLVNSSFSSDKFVAAIISNQYSDSSTSSTTMHILLKNSAFDLPRQAAR